jgi:hypothetical protein
MRNLTVLFLLFASLFLGINHYITTTDNHNILQKVLGGFQVNAQEVTSCPVPIDIARLIKAANGNPFKTLRYTQKNGKVIWLEEGNSRSGWQHILERHEQDFYNKFGNIGKSDIQDKIIEAINKGSYKREVVMKNGIERITETYEYNNVRVNVSGGNGYIVSANPY